MIVAVLGETLPGERRVAMSPQAAGPLVKAGHEIRVQSGAGLAAGFPDERFAQRGARIVATRQQAIDGAQVILQVRTFGANPQAGTGDLELLRRGQTLIGLAEPLSAHAQVRALAETGINLLALELIPRITRAQSMDVLSSQASLAGYKAVLMAAEALPKMLPMMMTAAGTIRPARVFIIGAGVAGLQAIATAKRLGAVVTAYDVRPAVKEQVQSLGARFLELPLEAAGEDGAGYARAQSEEQVRRQRELMSKAVAESDVVITTAAVPGQRAPILVTAAMVAAMAPGSVIVDLAAERGGNCELTERGQTVQRHGVTIIGHDNIPATIALDASQMFANNVASLLKHLTDKQGGLRLDAADEIVRSCLVCRDGQIVHPLVRQAMGLPSLESGASAAMDQKSAEAAA